MVVRKSDWKSENFRGYLGTDGWQDNSTCQAGPVADRSPERQGKMRRKTDAERG